MGFFASLRMTQELTPPLPSPTGEEILFSLSCRRGWGEVKTRRGEVYLRPNFTNNILDFLSVRDRI